MQAILHAAHIALNMGVPARLATIVHVEGSAFRSPGARLLILPDRTVGTISGGCLEAEVAQRARAMPAESLPAVLRYDTRQEDEALLGWGSGCGGAITLLIEELRPNDSDQRSQTSNLKSEIPPSSAAESLAFIGERHAAGEPGVLATVYESSDSAIARIGDRIQLSESASREGNENRSETNALPFSPRLHRLIEADACRVRASRRWKSAKYEVASAEVRVLLEPIVPPIRLLICGIGEEAGALSRLAKQLGWHVTLADPRLDPSRPIAEADRILDCRPDELLAAAKMPGEFAVAIMTHRLLWDAELLAELLPSRARYVGVLGPKRRLQLLLDTLPGPPPTPRQLSKLHGPAGLDLGGETPAEIALSITAEIAAVFAGRRGGMLRHRRRGIHGGPVDETPEETPAERGANGRTAAR